MGQVAKTMNGLVTAIEEMAKAEHAPNELTRATAKDQSSTLYPDTRYPWQVAATKRKIVVPAGAIKFTKETHVNEYQVIVVVTPKKIGRGR